MSSNRLNEFDDSEEYLVYRAIIKFRDSKKNITENYLQELLVNYDPFEIFVNEESKWAIVTFLTKGDADHFIENFNASANNFVIEYAHQPAKAMNTYQKKKLLQSQTEDIKKYTTMKRQCDLLSQKTCASTKYTSKADAIISDSNGELNEEDYGNSIYRNYCESYMVACMTRYLDPEDILTGHTLSKYNSPTIRSGNNQNPSNSSSNTNKERFDLRSPQNPKKFENIGDIKIEHRVNSNIPNKVYKVKESPQTTTKPSSWPKESLEMRAPPQSTSKIEKVIEKQNTSIRVNKISSEKLPEDVFTKVTCQVAINYFEGWVTLLDKEDAINSIAINLNSNTENQPVTPVEGLVCAAEFEGVWCRVVVTNVRPLKVHYIDYGNNEEITGKSLKRIDEKVAQIPAQAIHITLEPGSSKPLVQESVISIKPVGKKNDVIIVQTSTDASATKKVPVISEESPRTKVHSEFINERPRPVRNHSPTKIRSPNKVEQKQMLPTLVPADATFKANKNMIAAENSLPKSTVQRKSLIELLDTNCEGVATIKTLLNKNTCTVVLKHIKEFNKEFECIEEMWRKYPSGTEKSSFLPNELVAVEYEDEWCRGCVTQKNNGSWDVRLVDLGIVVSVESIFPLLNEYLYIPEFSCSCTITKKFITEEKFAEMFQENKAFGFQILEKNSNFVKCTFLNRKNKQSVCEVILSRWAPNSIQKDSSETKDLFIATTNLTPGNIIKVAFIESQNSLFVANKNSQSFLKQIEVKIRNFTRFQNVTTAKKGQYVLAKSVADGEFYRAVIMSIKDNTAKILYIDYGNTEDVSVTNLKKIPEELTAIPAVLNRVSLKNIPSQPVNDAFIKILEDLYRKGTKCKLVFDLICNGVVLEKEDQTAINDLFYKKIDEKRNMESSWLENNKTESKLQKPVQVEEKNVESPKEVNGHNGSEDKYDDLTIPTIEIPLGVQKVIFQCIVDAESHLIACSPPDYEKLRYILEEMTQKISNYVSTLKMIAYCPPIQSFCLAKFEGEWYRGLCIEIISDKEAVILFVDFGNMENVSTEQIRPIQKEFLEPPCLGLVFILQDIPDSINNDEFTACFEKESLYDVNVLSSEGYGMYNVTMPHIAKQLKK